MLRMDSGFKRVYTPGFDWATRRTDRDRTLAHMTGTRVTVVACCGPSSSSRSVRTKWHSCSGPGLGVDPHFVLLDVQRAERVKVNTPPSLPGWADSFVKSGRSHQCVCVCSKNTPIPNALRTQTERGEKWCISALICLMHSSKKCIIRLLLSLVFTPAAENSPVYWKISVNAYALKKWKKIQYNCKSIGH